MPEFIYNPEHRGHSLRHDKATYTKGDLIELSEEAADILRAAYGLADLLLPKGDELSEDDPPPRLGGRPAVLPEIVYTMKVRQLHKLVRGVYGGQVKTRNLSKANSLAYLQKADPHVVLDAIEALE